MCWSVKLVGCQSLYEDSFVPCRGTSDVRDIAAAVVVVVVVVVAVGATAIEVRLSSRWKELSNKIKDQYVKSWETTCR